jgi:hypothetical protein
VRHELAALDADRHMGNCGRSGCVLWLNSRYVDDDMNIDETLWPLPNAFNIREGSPFGRSPAFVKAAYMAAKSRKGGSSSASKSNDPQQKRKIK